MKIGVVAPYASPEKGAVVTRAESFRSFFEEEGHEVVIAAPEKDVEEMGHVHRFSGLRGLAGFIRKQDVVVGTTPHPGYTAVAAVLSKILGKRFVLDVRDPWVYAREGRGDLEKGSLKYYRDRFAESISVRLAEKVASVSEFIIDIFEESYGLDREKAFIAINGVDEEDFYYSEEEREEKREDMGLEGKTVLVYEGIPGKEKELDRFAEATEPLFEEKDDLHAVFVFTSRDEELEGFIEDKLGEEKTTFLHDLSIDELRKVLNASDIGINPLQDSQDFCLPVKTYEYMATGNLLPCKSPENGALHNQFEEYRFEGFFTRNWDDFQDRFEELVEEGNNAERNITLVEENFLREKAWEKYREEVFSL